MSFIVLPGLAIVGALTVTGLVLLVVGLATRKPPLWGVGIGLLALGLSCTVLAAAGFFFFGLRVSRSRRLVPSPSPSTSTSTAYVSAAPGEMPKWFQAATGLAPPEGTTFARGAHQWTRTDEIESHSYFMKMAVPAEFGDLLARHFRPADWSEVTDAMTPQRSGRPDFWDVAEGDGLACYSQSRAGPDGYGMENAIAYDKQAGVAYFVCRRGCPLPPAPTSHE